MGAGQLAPGQERVPGLTWRAVGSVADVLAVLAGRLCCAIYCAMHASWGTQLAHLAPPCLPLSAEGSKNRATAATSLNAHSSRSHALLSVRLTDAAGQSSVLHLVDLAGGMPVLRLLRLLCLLRRALWRRLR